MKEKISLFVMAAILIVPVTLYALFKAPVNNAAIAVANKPTVIEFSTPLCAECQKLKKVLDTVEPKYKRKITFEKINASMMDKETIAKVQQYEVRVVPTTIFMDNKGNIVSKVEGSMPQKTLEHQLDELTK